MNLEMTRKLAGATLAFGLLAAAAAPALAADMISAGPGVKYVPQGVAVPVPAPMPVENYPARWYFRLDAALGIRGDSPFHESGTVFGDPPPGSGTFRSRPSWFTNDSDIYAGFGAGVGYYFSRWFRADITVDTRGENKLGGTRSYTYTDTGGNPVAGTYTEDTRLTSVPVLFNAYWDFARRWGGLKPYVGLGVGFSINELSRKASITENGTIVDAASAKANDVSFAAMGTVGATYEVDPSWALDFNYRLLYVGGSDIGMGLDGRRSVGFVGDQLDHQFRAGVRINVY